MGALDNETIIQTIKILGIIFSFFHFLVGFVLYRDIVRINSIIKKRRRIQFLIIADIYVLGLFLILVFFILV